VLILKRASASRSSGQRSDDDFDVLANGEVVDRIFKADAALVGGPLDVDIAIRALASLPWRRREELAYKIKKTLLFTQQTS
jgi:hypothetical protein